MLEWILAATVWFFGTNAGLSFEGGSATPLPGPLRSIDGVSVQSDQVTGEQLFYTDGRTVWSRDHSIMANGTSLAGNPSSAQSAFIIPEPGNPARFYIFTTGAANTSQRQYGYSLVDLDRNSGLGEVVLKNETLLEDATETSSGTVHCNQRDYWAVTHGTGNSFYSHLITPSGVSAPVISEVGTSIRGNGDIQGTIQFIPRRDMLVWTSRNAATVELFDFDTETGEVANPRQIDRGIPAYGAEFSPDGTRLYVMTAASGYGTSYLFQYDLEAGDASAIQASRDTLESVLATWGGGQLQIGPDGRIYASWAFRSFLGVIDKPNELGGLSMYRHDGIDLGTGRTQYGLPNLFDALLFGQSERTCPLPTGCDTSIQLSISVTPKAVYETGRRVQIPVNLDSAPPLDSLMELTIELEWNPSLLILSPEDSDMMTSGTLLQDWDLIEHSGSRGRLAVRYAAAAGSGGLANSGVLISPAFRMYLPANGRDNTVSPLLATLRFPDSECISARPAIGEITLDSICGLTMRMIEMLPNAKFGVLGVIGSGGSISAISYDVPFGGDVLLAVYDMNGSQVASHRAIDVRPGTSFFDIAPLNLANGSYWAVMTFAGMTRSCRIELR